MKEKKDINVFLAKNFLLVILGIAVCELGINCLYSYGLFPVLRQQIGGPFFSDLGLSGYGSSVIYTSFFWLIAQGILSILPQVISTPIYRFLEGNLGKYIPSEVGRSFHDGREKEMTLYYIGCFIILLMMLIVALLPYIVGAFIYSRLIRKELTQLRQQDKRKHQEYDKKRSLMLSDIAHDLKTPITTVSGYAQALQDGMITDEKKQQQYLQAIVNKAQRMNDLISILFEYVKIDSEGFTLHLEKTDVAEIMRENIALFYSDFEQKGIEMVLDIPEEQIWWNIDKIQFSRAISNLLSNDLRHIGKGQQVIVRLIWHKEYERISILLGDTGEQITDTVAKHIFEPFVMGDASRSTKGGSGLGLSISSKIVKMHGGRLYLDRNTTSEYTKAFVIVLKE